MPSCRVLQIRVKGISIDSLILVLLIVHPYNGNLSQRREWLKWPDRVPLFLGDATRVNEAWLPGWISTEGSPLTTEMSDTIYTRTQERERSKKQWRAALTDKWSKAPATLCCAFFFVPHILLPLYFITRISFKMLKLFTFIHRRRTFVTVCDGSLGSRFVLEYKEETFPSLYYKCEGDLQWLGKPT